MAILMSLARKNRGKNKTNYVEPICFTGGYFLIALCIENKGDVIKHDSFLIFSAFRFLFTLFLELNQKLLHLPMQVGSTSKGNDIGNRHSRNDEWLLAEDQVCCIDWCKHLGKWQQQHGKLQNAVLFEWASCECALIQSSIITWMWTEFNSVAFVWQLEVLAHGSGFHVYVTIKPMKYRYFSSFSHQVFFFVQNSLHFFVFGIFEVLRNHIFIYVNSFIVGARTEMWAITVMLHRKNQITHLVDWKQLRTYSNFSLTTRFYGDYCELNFDDITQRLFFVALHLHQRRRRAPYSFH